MPACRLGSFRMHQNILCRRTYFPSWRSFTVLLVCNFQVCNLHQRGHKTPRQLAFKTHARISPNVSATCGLSSAIARRTKLTEPEGFPVHPLSGRLSNTLSLAVADPSHCDTRLPRLWPQFYLTRSYSAFRFHPLSLWIEEGNSWEKSLNACTRDWV